MKNTKKILALVLALMMVLSLAACNSSGDGGKKVEGTTYTFEGEYAKVTGTPIGMVTNYFGLSNNCFLSKDESASNGFVLDNLYEDSNSGLYIEFIINADAAGPAEIVLVARTAAENINFEDVATAVKATEAYPLSVNGTAASSSYSLSGDDEISKLHEISYGTVDLKEGENIIRIDQSAYIRGIDCLKITSAATLTMENNTGKTYMGMDNAGTAIEYNMDGSEYK